LEGERCCGDVWRREGQLQGQEGGGEASQAALHFTFPKKTWPGTKDYFKHPKWHKTPGKEIKTARWEKREAKKGPAK